MLKTRIIPTLLWKEVGLVKGVGFDSWRRVGSAMPAVKVYNTRDVDELILLDITATMQGNQPDVDEIATLAAECFVPFTVGGGIRSLDTVRSLLLAGADKVTINSAAYDMPNLITESASCFGSQCVVISIDVRKDSDNQYRCYSHAGSVSTGYDPVEWAQLVEKLGAGEILLTRVEYDGTMNGYDLELIQQVSSAVSIPVIAQGGAGNYSHMLDALNIGGASAVAAASLFHFTEQTPLAAKEFLSQHGVPVRKS
jgi:cyclase